MVGFVLYGVEAASGNNSPRSRAEGGWKVFRLMIDREHQGQGYGRAALELVIERLASQPGCREIFISYHDDNHAARRLYASLGFVEQGVEDGVVRALLELKGVKRKT
jgi:diamine N-acetyltransferase